VQHYRGGFLSALVNIKHIAVSSTVSVDNSVGRVSNLLASTPKYKDFYPYHEKAML
jgi:hypothetical protein